MPLALTFVEPDLFVVTATGDVAYPEAASTIREIGESDRLQSPSRILVDARAVTGAPTTNELRVLARSLRPIYERGAQGVAIVTTGTFIYGVARMFSMFAEAFDLKVSVFRDFGEATNWLDEQVQGDDVTAK